MKTSESESSFLWPEGEQGHKISAMKSILLALFMAVAASAADIQVFSRPMAVAPSGRRKSQQRNEHRAGAGVFIHQRTNCQSPC